MLLLAADENFSNDIVRAYDDASLTWISCVFKMKAFQGQMIRPFLEWAAQQGRILLTHDVSTITHYAYDRVRAGSLCPASLKWVAISHQHRYRRYSAISRI